MKMVNEIPVSLFYNIKLLDCFKFIFHKTYFIVFN